MLRKTMTGSADDGRSILECGHRLPSSATDPVGESEPKWDCQACDQRIIPPSTTVGRRTATFTAATVPPGLLAAHKTSVWARLEVTAGSVLFVDEHPPWQTTATPRHPVVIVPDRLHHIVPAEDAEFAVQFFDHGPAELGPGPSDE